MLRDKNTKPSHCQYTGKERKKRIKRKEKTIKPIHDVESLILPAGYITLKSTN
jgi:hypothetical protein